jgi:hypothetical protein
LHYIGGLGMAFIRYSPPNKSGVIYASVVESVRVGKKVQQKHLTCLGCVINREKGIFRNQERGVFHYSIENGYTAAEGYEEIETLRPPEKEKLILDFGDSFVLNEYIHKLSFWDVFKAAALKNPDTLMSLLMFRILTDKKAYCLAEVWWSGNYVRELFPKAQLKSQRISEFLALLGDEEVQRGFFEKYLEALYGSQPGCGVLIDSSGLPNASKMSITQINNHNGEINMEVRLVYVIDRRNGMPIYFRYCPGNIVDVSTLRTTVAELAQYKIDVNYAIVDAGYFSEENIKSLYEDGINFVTRLAPNRTLYKETATVLLPNIMSSANAIRYGNRLVYIKKSEVDVYGHKGYAFLGVDADSRNQQLKRTVFHTMDDKLSPEDADKRIEKLGLFLLLTSEDMEVDEILPLYYTRQQVEQVFDIGKNYADILPLRIQNEDTFRGHLMLTFMATAILQKLQKDIIIQRKKGDKTNPEGALMNLRNQKCKVYAKSIIPQEPVKEINAVYKLLKIDCPISIPREIM